MLRLQAAQAVQAAQAAQADTAAQVMAHLTAAKAAIPPQA
jgi:hypothetical protein